MVVFLSSIMSHCQPTNLLLHRSLFNNPYTHNNPSYFFRIRLLLQLLASTHHHHWHSNIGCSGQGITEEEETPPHVQNRAATCVDILCLINIIPLSIPFLFWDQIFPLPILVGVSKIFEMEKVPSSKTQTRREC